MPKITTIVPELSPSDCFHIVDRHKRTFAYPLHRHKAIEINFIQNGKGVQRTIRETTEEIDAYDLIIVGENIEHIFKQGSCTSGDIREITLHFPVDLFNGSLIDKHQFAPIKKMLQDCNHGIAFSMETIMKVYSIIDGLSKENNGIEQFMQFLRMLFILSTSDYRIVSKETAAKVEVQQGNEKIDLIKEYIEQHFQADVTLAELSKLSGMPPTSLSRFFRQMTGMTISTFIIDTRLTKASRLLVDTSNNIADICKECGFNNLSNFNRIFKERKGKTPREYRSLYKKNMVTV